jgi:hypothetical protein
MPELNIKVLEKVRECLPHPFVLGVWQMEHLQQQPLQKDKEMVVCWR